MVGVCIFAFVIVVGMNGGLLAIALRAKRNDPSIFSISLY
jgi:hypothetical protein